MKIVTTLANIFVETAMGTSLHDADPSFKRQYCQAVHELGNIVIYR